MNLGGSSEIVPANTRWPVHAVTSRRTLETTNENETMNDLKRKLVELLLCSDEPTETTATTQAPDLGPQQIFVLDRGYVYAGQAVQEGDFWRMSNARNIRYWGTTKGLGELVDGPTDKTKLDEVGEVLIPAKSVIHIIKCNRVW